MSTPLSQPSSRRRMRVIIAGGGTGGHIFPALAIADELKHRLHAEILFVGAENRMEMTRVPEAGYTIVGLPVAGFDRKNLLKNFKVLVKLYKSLRMARKVVADFHPDMAVGVGGYASGPLLKVAQKKGIVTLIQEQNSYAGVTNKMLAPKAGKVCVAYDGMDRFFPVDRIVKTGNPIRRSLLEYRGTVKDARESFGLSPSRSTLLVVGGSLGARTINESLEKGLNRLAEKGIQVIWQTGKNFGDRGVVAAKGMKGIVVTPFISDMGAAYKAADLVVSRAGAGSISELQCLGKPCVLVPSPNVAEDHQTHNARALSDKGAAILVTDAEAREKLIDTVLALITDEKKLKEMSQAVSEMAMHDSAAKIVDEAVKLVANVGN